MPRCCVIHDGKGNVLARCDVPDGPTAQAAAKASAAAAVAVLKPAGQTHTVELAIASIGVTFNISPTPN